MQACHIIGEHPDAWRAPVIPRGDLQATFVFKGFNEVQRLGLTHATEAAVRAASCKSANSGGYHPTLIEAYTDNSQTLGRLYCFSSCTIRVCVQAAIFSWSASIGGVYLTSSSAEACLSINKLSKGAVAWDSCSSQVGAGVLEVIALPIKQRDVCAGESGGTTGMLVVDSVIPGGPADGLLEPGDVLVRILGEVIVHFLPMEALLDDHVGQHVSVEIERGGQLLVQHIQVSLPMCGAYSSQLIAAQSP